jgi:hypothetical protein
VKRLDNGLILKALGEAASSLTLRERLKIVGGFAAVGFVLPWLLLAFYAIAHRMGGNPSTAPLIYLCPSSIAALGLDNASLIVGLIGWLLISATNAVLYAIPGIVVALLVGVWKSNRPPTPR